MKKIAASKFSGEKKEGEDIVQLAGDHQQVIWYGGRVMLPSILEENCLISQALSNQTHEVGAPSQGFAIPAPLVVYNPTPLRCFLPPTVDFNGIHIPTVEVDVDTAFGLSNYAPRKSDEIKKRESNNPMPDLGRLRHDSFAGVEVDDVDTVLSLRLPGTTNPKKSRMQKGKGKGKALDHNPTGDMSNLGWIRLPPDFFDGVEDDVVDTTLSLRLPGTTDPRKSRMQEKGKGKVLDHNPTGDMSNLGRLRHDFFAGVEVDTVLSLRPPGTADPRKSRMQEKGKKRKADAGDTERKKTSKRRSIGEEENSRPLIPIEEIPTLMKAVESRNGSRPIFLYRKILEDTDRSSHHNRLFVTRRDEMMNFLRTEEKAAVVNLVGQKIVGVDGRGNVFDNLVLKKWYSLKMTVINSDWRKVVEANEAEAGDVVEIWGFRGVDEKPCFAFNFRKQNAAGASTSGTSGNDEGTSMA